MPKIEVNEKAFFDLLGFSLDRHSLEDALIVAKAEIDEWGTEPKDAGDRSIKIELNDTNRPDLWSTAGLARQLRIYNDYSVPEYPFFSTEEHSQPAQYRASVDPELKNIRPYLAAFIISGKPIDDEMLKDSIQTQEKLCHNFGRRRSTVSMGMYRIELIKWPVSYKAADPDSKSFVPLQMEKALSLREILKQHPKGKEYGHIISSYKKFPLLLGADGGILSMAPIINSADIGAVQVGDTDILVEFTGQDLEAVSLSASIVACDFYDAGYEIKPVAIDYPWETKFGKTVTYPYYFQTAATVDSTRASRLLGLPLSPDRIQAALLRMGLRSETHGQYVKAWPPEYRNDYLHQVDIIEDIMIGHGMKEFSPERPRDFTIGRLSQTEVFSRKLKESIIGLGYQEMIYNYLGSKKDLIDRMNIDGKKVLRISNPMSENFEYLRPSILPSLLQSESISSKAVYPHRIFEAGKVAFADEKENYGSKTRQWLGVLTCHPQADFNELSQLWASLLYYAGVEYQVVDADDPRFLPGRQAMLVLNRKELGIFGEVHPQVLENWGITMPCAAGEIDIESLMECGGR